MELIYNGIDITNKVDIMSASIFDRCGGNADSINLLFSDSQKLWRKWNPLKGDLIIVSHGNFSSGVMYVDETEALKGRYGINALSTPLKAKSNKSYSWENIRFKGIAKQLVEEIGLSLETYDIEDYLYDKLDMIDKTNLGFLNTRCILEGYSLKITNGKAIIYDEKSLEKYNAVKDITEDLIIGDYSLGTVSSGLYSACEIEYFSNNNKLIKYRFSPKNPPIGPILKSNIRANSQGEAERYAKGILRNVNKNEITGRFNIGLDMNLAAGNTVNLKGFGSFDGKYFINIIRHDLLNGKSYLKVRKVLEEY